MITIIPSILTDDINVLKERFELINSNVNTVHIDVMDGEYVESKSISIKEIKEVLDNIDYKCKIELHLLIENPAKYITEIVSIKNIESVIIQSDIKSNLKSAVEKFRNSNIKVGLSFPLEDRDKIDMKIDYLLVLSEEEPGFGGSGFDSIALDQIEYMKEHYPKLMLEVDGGINELTGKRCLEAGADRLISNTFIFESASPIDALHKLEKLDESE